MQNALTIERSRSLVRRSCYALLTAATMLVTSDMARAQDLSMPAKAAVWLSCHGVGGNSTTAANPNLAAQPKQFLVSALYVFWEGKCKNEQMAPFASNLTNADMNELATYFSAQLLEVPKSNPSAAQMATGKALAQQNNCVACYAATLSGQQHIPRLARQHFPYLKAQLVGFHVSTRYDPDGSMTSAAQALSVQDIEVLSVYLAGLPATPAATAK